MQWKNAVTQTGLRGWNPQTRMVEVQNQKERVITLMEEKGNPSSSIW